VFVYRLATPIDEFDDLVPLPDWLREGSPESVAWMLQAVLAVQDAAAKVRWGGDMRHLPSVSVRADDGPYLVAKQNNNGDTFVISTGRLPWAEPESDLHHETQPRDIAPFTHPTAADIAEAMTSLPRLDRTNIDAADSTAC
jgi:hypothetical protein